MNIKKSLLLIATVSSLAIVAMTVTPGCTTTGTGTNAVTTIDPVKLAKVQQVVSLNAASVLRRVIQNSPQHSAEIGNYARAVGTVFCNAAGSGKLTPDDIIRAADQATAGLQVGVDPLILDAKNGLMSLYVIFFDDALTIQLKANQWPIAVCQTICGTIDQALKDSGLPGLKP